MGFGEQIKRIREEAKLTQAQMAERLNVTRQAVSNWENDRNLPDIEMLIAIAASFRVSLDRLILGETDMNNMTEKLIRDGSETRMARMNLTTAIIGAALLLIGVGLIVIKAFSVEYIDAEGVLHESFFLIPTAFLFLFAGFITFLVSGIRNAFSLRKNSSNKAAGAVYMLISAGVVLISAGGLLMLIVSNSGAPLTVPGIIAAGLGLLCFAAAAMLAVRGRKKTDKS